MGHWREGNMQLENQKGNCSNVKFTTVKDEIFLYVLKGLW